MACQNCGSEQVAQVSGKCSDMCSFRLGDKEIHGYVPGKLGVGGSDYIEFHYCLDCGQIQAPFPVSKERIEEVFEEE